jgi:hypothetical protein
MFYLIYVYLFARCLLNDAFKMMWKAAVVAHVMVLTHYSPRRTDKRKENPVSQEVSVPGQDSNRASVEYKTNCRCLGHHSGDNTNPSITAHVLSAVSAPQNEGLPA